MLRHIWAAIAVLSAATVLGTATPALAFDTGPHQEMTSDALTAEGFGTDAVGVMQVNNWFCDLYEQAEKNPFSGHAGFWKRLLTFAASAEDWPDSVIAAAWRCHFDNSLALSNTAAETAEWDRLRRAVWTLVQEAREHDDPEELLTVLGISEHEVQDFYAHTNWVEPQKGHGLTGADGPGWQERGFGSYPTWFDVPAAARDAATVYSDESQGHRPHGVWNSDGNINVRSAMNKDWPGRPYYMPATISAYFATRQWVEAVRSWVDDDAFWSEAQHFRANQPQLKHDLQGRFEIPLSIGHWQGQGEPSGGERGPGGDLLASRAAVREYFNPEHAPFVKESKYRTRFEQLIMRVEEPNPTGHLGPVPSSQDLQRSMRLVVLHIDSLNGEGLGDPGPDDADMYANVGIDGQQMTSAVINNRDDFSFPRPNAPFTWIKAVPAEPNEQEPVESIEVEVKTADVRWAGTNDDVFLRLGSNLRFPLDKGLYDDFERGDRDTYSVPIDAAVKNGLRVGDITRVGIEKSGDGIGGGWKLEGVKLRVNGSQVYDNQHINRWLEDDHLGWSAPDFTPSDPSGPVVPIWMNLREADSFVYYGSDDEGDINPYDGRDIFSFGYVPGESRQGIAKGGNRLKGRRDKGGDHASITYDVETITPELMQPQSPTPPTPLPQEPPPREPLPDLAVTGFDAGTITVTNQGAGPSSFFRVKVANAHSQRTEMLAGLQPGASETWSFPAGSCQDAYYLATVDDLEQVAETDETNNTIDIGPPIC